MIQLMIKCSECGGTVTENKNLLECQTCHRIIQYNMKKIKKDKKVTINMNETTSNYDMVLMD